MVLDDLSTRSSIDPPHDLLCPNPAQDSIYDSVKGMYRSVKGVY